MNNNLPPHVVPTLPFTSISCAVSEVADERPWIVALDAKGLPFHYVYDFEDNLQANGWRFLGTGMANNVD